MTVIVALILALLRQPPEAAANALRSTASTYLTHDAAAQHLLAATAAGLVYGIRPELLLAIAYHESRYRPDTRTREPGGRESCGVMTPMPIRRCRPFDLTILNGYTAGAAHLSVWLSYYGTNDALLAYAGGGALVRTCRRGPYYVQGANICLVARYFQARARFIEQALAQILK